MFLAVGCRHFFPLFQEEREYREMQEALRRQSRERRRLSEARRAELTATMRKRDRELENDLQASAEAGAKDVEAYREVPSYE